MSQGLTIYPSPRTTGKYAKNVWDLQLFDGKIYIGQGNSSNYGLEQNAGPIPAYSLNPNTGLYTNEFTIDEEQIDIFKVLNGDLYIPGHDPLESWALGNFYRKSIGGNWVKKRTIPNGVHTYDMEYFDGKLFAALGVGGSSSHKSRAVSFDMGETWVELETTNNNRTGNCVVFNNELYFLGYTYYIELWSPQYLLKYVEGESVLGQVPNPEHLIPLNYYSPQTGAKPKSGSVINFNGYLIYILGDTYNDHQILHRKLCKTNDLTQHASHVDFPELNYIPTDLLVRGVNLYVIGHVHSNGRYINIIYKTTNLSIWEEEVRYDTLYIFAMSFEELNGDFYLGMGTYERLDASKIPENNGDIVKLESTYEYTPLLDPSPDEEPPDDNPPPDEEPPDEEPPDEEPPDKEPPYNDKINEGGYLMSKTFRNQKLLSSDIVKDSYVKINENAEEINSDLEDLYIKNGSIGKNHPTSNSFTLDPTTLIRRVTDSVDAPVEFVVDGSTIEQIVINGDFTNGITGWGSTNATLSTSEKVLSIQGDGVGSVTKGFINLGRKLEGQSLWGKVRFRVTNSEALNIYFIVSDGSDGDTITNGSILIPTPVINQWYTVYLKTDIITNPIDNIHINIQAEYLDPTVANGKVLQIEGDDSKDGGVFAIPIVGTPYENAHQDQINIMINKYWEGLYSSDKINILTRGENLLPQSIFQVPRTSPNSYILNEGIIPIDSSKPIYINYNDENIPEQTINHFIAYDKNMIEITSGITATSFRANGLSNTLTYSSGTWSNSVSGNYIRFTIDANPNIHYIRIGLGGAYFTYKEVSINQDSEVFEFQQYFGSKVSINCTDPSKFTLSNLHNLGGNSIEYKDGGNSIEYKYGRYKAIKRVSSEYTLLSSDIISLSTHSLTHVSVVFTPAPFKPDFTFSPTSSAIGKNISIVGRSQILASERDSVDNIGSFYIGLNGTIAFVVPLGSTLEDARLELEGTKLIYRLSKDIEINDSEFEENGIIVNGHISSSNEYMEFIGFDYDKIPPIININYAENIEKGARNTKESIIKLSNANQTIDKDLVALDNRIKHLEYTTLEEIGVEWNQGEDNVVRVAGAKDFNRSNFDTLKPWVDIKRCMLNDDGTVNYYIDPLNPLLIGEVGNPTYITGDPANYNGLHGQVMVEIPKFWYRSSKFNKEYQWYISCDYKKGYKVHPAFIRAGVEIDKVYFSAFEGFYNATTFKLESRADAVPSTSGASSDGGLTPYSRFPAVGDIARGTLPNCRIHAQARGTNWEMQDFYTVSAIQLLLLVEYASFDSQGQIGRGVVGKPVGSSNNANKTGATIFLGNASGQEVGVDGLCSVSYRGIENFWGNIHKYVDGINFDRRLYNLEAFISDSEFKSDKTTSPYFSIGEVLNVTFGYATDITFNDKTDSSFLPRFGGGDSASYLYDIYQGGSTIKTYVAAQGGGWMSNTGAGAFNWVNVQESWTTNSGFGARLLYLPK